jgi:Flp pilus assembly pilin Flp
MGKVWKQTMTVTSVLTRVKEFARRASAEEGQAVVEYALLLALISLTAFGIVNEFGLSVSGLYSKIVANFPK